MKKILLILIVVFITFCKNNVNSEKSGNNQTADSSDLSTFEMPPYFKSVVTNFIDSIHKEGYMCNLFDLMLREYNQDTSVFWITEEVSLYYLIQHPPICYTKIDSNIILYVIPYENQIKTNFLRSKLYSRLIRRYSKEPKNMFSPRGIIITVFRDSVIKISNNFKGHIFLRCIEPMLMKNNSSASTHVR
jgi:hypothetical protein